MKFHIYDPRSKSTTTKGRRKLFKEQNYKLFEQSMNLKEPESEDHLNILNQRSKSRPRASPSKPRELEGLVSHDFLRQIDSNFMAQKESRIAGWEKMGREGSLERGNDIQYKKKVHTSGYRSPIQKNLPLVEESVTNLSQIQQTHTAKRRNERSLE